VRFAGEPIAAVVATSREAARDAQDLISVEIEAADPIVDPEKALAKGAPLVHPELETNHAFDWTLKSGDVDAAFRSADRVVSQKLVHQRLVPVSIETRGAVAQYDAGEERLTLWTSTQIPHLVRTMLAGTLGLPENR